MQVSAPLRSRRAWGVRLTPWLFLLLPLALFTVIFILPTLQVLWLSMTQWQLFKPKAFIGLENYRTLFADPLFWKSLRITTLWALAVVPGVLALALPIAVVMNSRWLRLKGLWRLVYFLPVITNIVAASFVWRWLFDPQFGSINYGLGLLGLPKPGWLADPDWALLAMIIVAVWKQLGVAMVLLLAGLQTIPRELEEAAQVDGASAGQAFWKVTLPLLNPTVVFVSVILVINAFRVFTIPFVMSSGGLSMRAVGGPLDSTRVYVLHLYDLAFAKLNLGLGAAAAVVLLFIMLIVTLLQIKLVQRNFEY